MALASASFEHSKLLADLGFAADAGVAVAGAAAAGAGAAGFMAGAAGFMAGAGAAAAGAAGFGTGVWAIATVANRPIAAAAASLTKDVVIETSRKGCNAA
jgi:hypothetical protein